MEVSLQPSFTFPSRKVYANRALGLQAQIDLQRLTTIPKHATDISTETAFYNTLFTPKTLDKETIDWPAVLPVATPMYVQPGTAEGLTQVAVNQQFDYDIKTMLSANNALKRGNYHSAEHILGRPITAEENANQTVTPNVRRTQAGEKVHVGNFAGNLGTKLPNGGSQQQQQNALRMANQQFFYDLAHKLGLDVNAVMKMKIGSNYIGQLDFSAYGRSTSAEERENILMAIYNRLKHDALSSQQEKELKEQLRKEAEVRASSSREYELYQQNMARKDATMHVDMQGNIHVNPDGSWNMKEFYAAAAKAARDGVWDEKMATEDTRGPSVGPVRSVFADPTEPMDTHYEFPENKYAEDEDNMEEEIDTDKLRMKIDKVGDVPVTDEGHMDMDELRRMAAKGTFDEYMRPAGDQNQTPIRSVFMPTDSNGVPQAPPLETPAVQEFVQVEIPMAPPIDKEFINRMKAVTTDAQLDLIKSIAEREGKGLRSIKLPRLVDEAEMTPSDQMQAELKEQLEKRRMNIDERAVAVLDAPKGERVPKNIGPPIREPGVSTEVHQMQLMKYYRDQIGLLQEELDNGGISAKRQKAIKVSMKRFLNAIEKLQDEGLYTNELTEQVAAEYNNRKRRRGEVYYDYDVDQDEKDRPDYVRIADKEGAGLLGSKRRKKRNNIRHPGIDDRWNPDADGFFPGGAPVSGNYMRKTGANAIPISAQLQVQNTHQFTELPVRKFTQFPNMESEVKSDVIPIAQNSGQAPRGVIISNKGKVSFGSYNIDKSKLMGEGILSLSHPNGRKVHGFPNQRLSKGAHHAITQIVKGGAVNQRKLGAEDKIFLTKLLQRSHANVPKLGAEVNMPPEKQLQLILGECEAGNDSPALKSQLKKLLPYMKRMKMITAGHVEDITKHYL